MVNSTGRPNWQCNLLTKLVKNKSTLLIKSDKDKKPPLIDLGALRLHESLEELQDEIRNCYPILAFLGTDDDDATCLCLLCKEGNKRQEEGIYEVET